MEERRSDKRLLLHSWVQITGIDKAGQQFSERSQLEDVGDSGCRFTLPDAVQEGCVVGIMPLDREGEALPDEFPRLFVVIWVKRKGNRLTIGTRSLREEELSDGGSPTNYSASKIYAR